MKIDELKKYDGKDGRPAYIAYKGNIYDVTESKLWKNGSHINRHFAGEDLTHQMAVAPHGDDLMAKFKIIGKLEIEEKAVKIDKMEKRRDFYRKYHPHPVLVHFPMGLLFFSCIMQCLFIIYNFLPFEHAAYYSLFAGAILGYPATFSGIYSWWINYQKLLTKTFRIKLYLSILLLIITSSALLIRIFVPEVSSSSGAGFYIYNTLLLVSFPIIGIVGYYGGKITWPS